MQIQSFVALSESAIAPEASLQLYSVSKPDREPVKILIIGSQAAVNTIIHSLHYHNFAEPFEWTQFLPKDRPIQPQPGESMRALIKYLPQP
ncbi:hypothetical protein N836_23195 [Leptolyngbya sp. Heron Island J]|uniref:hypothetical protein n=1 Tax=Leptolyngbya sp. Heron Island J TaxID=1385935 RepID=UPI0003B97F28|nr:hypothetical protein [Leptolyngbya sp. Heron Island J]ESA32972.1 hypothetical protein N836_23195 [Leptolyngbya sp. Heron Island J]